MKLLVAAKKTNKSRKGLFSKNDLGLLHYCYFFLYVNSLYNDVCFLFQPFTNMASFILLLQKQSKQTDIQSQMVKQW